MTYHWFSAYTGDRWTPERGYNETFRNQVVLLREWFGLKKTKTGHNEGTGLWREYRIQRETIYVTVDSFTWDSYRYVKPTWTRESYWLSHSHSFNNYTTPVFVLSIKIGKGATSEKKIFFKGTIEIEFPINYPSSPPLFRIKNLRYRAMPPSHKHHIYPGGVPCILADRGDWNSNRDTVVSGINALLDYIVWHHRKFGW